jgi:signal transduction histidine kinase/DNA-binding response OmpR family regulator/ligand-binding sensor domain-containing protein
MRCVYVGLLAAWSAIAGAQSPGFRIDHWSTDNGLPSHTISDVAQTRDGYLWIATPGGLVRTDGVSFRTYTTASHPELGEDRARAVYPGAGDTLWILLERQGVFALTGGRFRRVIANSRNIDYIVQDGKGVLYGGFSSVFRLDSTGRHQIGVARVTENPLRPLAARDEHGVVWIAGDRGRVLHRVTERGLEAGPSMLHAVITAPSRSEVFSAAVSGSRVVVTDRLGGQRATFPNSDGRVARLIDARGALWVTGRNIIEAYVAGSDRAVARFELPPGAVTHVVTEDREGNIWAGTREHGLFRVQRIAFTVVGKPEGFITEQVNSLWRGAAGGVYASDAMQRPFHITEDGRATPLTFRAPRGLPASGGTTGAVYTDRRGTLWVAWGRRAAPGALVGRRAGQPDIVLTGFLTPFRVIEDPHTAGVLWFHDGVGLHRTEPYATPPARRGWSVGAGGTLRDMAIDRRGRVWLAGYDVVRGQGRLVEVAGDTVRRFTSDSGLPRNELRAVIVDRDDVLWIGTYGAGILRYKNGAFKAVTAHDGLAENVVSSIVADDADNFWMSGNRGVHRVSRAEMNAFLDGTAPRVHGVAYNRRDGLRNPEASGWNAVRAGDGRMWFPTYDGAAVVNPAFALSLDSVPPLVRVESIVADGDSVRMDSAARLPRGRRRIEFAYTGISLRHPEAVRFQYRLDGVDADWVSAGSSRAAVYNNVGPGRYTFRVRAMNAGGVWSAVDAATSIGVPAYFHETGWFFAIAALATLGAAYGAHRYRVRDLERRRIQLNQIIDDRTADLAAEKRRTEATLRTVSQQAEQLKTLDEAKSRFFANVSHEFRTPLSLVIGPLEDIREGRAGPVSDSAGRKLDTVITSGRRLVRLVDQLLDISRLEAGALLLHADVHDIVAYVRRTAESFASLADRRGIDFAVTCPVGAIRVRFDSDQMDKVFSNVLGNAFKFTDTGGRVELRVWSAAVADGNGADAQVVVTVSDTGSGIPADALPRVFDRFYQVDDSVRREHEGAGIGLALVKELVELHGGRIDVASELGKGSTFTIRLPLAIGETKPLEPPRASPEAAARVSARRDEPVAPSRDIEAADGADVADVTTVLLVEDNAELLAYLSEHLATKYRVLQAPNGVRALEIARAHVPDLVVSDIMMPEMDGQTLCEAIKSDREIDFVPVILLTAKAARENRLAGLATGADDYLTKPVDLRELFIRAENLITSRRRLRERFREQSRSLPTIEAPHAQAQFDSGSQAFLRKLYDAFAARVGQDDVHVDMLAKDLVMSRRTLYRHTETALGKSPMDALRDYRLDQSAQWLRETDAYVSEVAYGVGFKSVPHFCARFRDRFGVTPSAYRAALPGDRKPSSSAQTA